MQYAHYWLHILILVIVVIVIPWVKEKTFTFYLGIFGGNISFGEGVLILGCVTIIVIRNSQKLKLLSCPFWIWLAVFAFRHCKFPFDAFTGFLKDIQIYKHEFSCVYTQDCLSPTFFICSIRSHKQDMPWIPSIKQGLLVGPWKNSFSALVPAL